MPPRGGQVIERLNAIIAAAPRAVPARDGIVVSQHHQASEIGAQVLRDGGNAVDAAVATAFTLGVVEPWMSGLGGVGYMLVGRAGEQPTVVDFGARSPQGLNPADYQIDDGVSHDLFPWPSVVGNRNTIGPLSVCAPTMALGMELGWQTFGSRRWAELVAPAAAVARVGLTIDWYTQLIISSVTTDLQSNPNAAKMFLSDDGSPPSTHWTGDNPPRINMDRLATTLDEIGSNGARSLLDGDLANAVIADLRELGSTLDQSDLLSAQPTLAEPECTDWYGPSQVWTVGGLTGGASVADMLQRWQDDDLPELIGPDYFTTVAAGGISCLKARLSDMGHSAADGETHPSCTTSFCVVDREGLVAATTITLVSLFGSKVISPTTGILLNNGVSWFDPEPGKPNSLAPGQPALTNMAPTLADLGNGRMIAIGAAGGRRIVPAIAQILANVLRLGRSVEDALAAPRIDFRGEGTITADSRLDRGVIQALADRWPVTEVAPTVFPYHFAIVSAAELTQREQLGYPELFCPNASASST